MGLFNKKEEKPQISPSPTLPALPTRTIEKPSELPSLPTNISNENLNERMIKSAVEDTSIETMDTNTTFQPREIPNLPDLQSGEPSAVTKDETIFVKIEKFKKSEETLKEIQEKVKELVTDIQILKEIKDKEIKELMDWDAELKEINNRLSKIDASIFSEV